MKISFFLALLAVIFLPVSQYAIWIYSPQEMVMGEVQRIFYMHLPLAWWALFGFFLVFLLSIKILLRPSQMADLLAVSLVEVGVVFTTLTLATGSIWARAAWNTWWTWDPRLSTALIMWFIYTAYLVLRKADFGESKQMRISAVLGIIAFLDVPLVFFSARLWRSIHPAIFSSRGIGLDEKMLVTVCICVVAVGFLFFGLVAVRLRQLLLEAQIKKRFELFLTQALNEK